jgi:diguanylate cyclase (GGDEF)-like protein
MKTRIGFAKYVIVLLVLTQVFQEQAVASSQVRRNVQFNNLTTHAGLSAEHVNAVVQDAHGYIWFGTQDGLNRFDGHEIVVFENDPDDPSSLSNNFVWALYLDANSDLWVATNKGVNKYDAEIEGFDRNPLKLPADMMPRVRTMVQDGTGIYWLGTVDQGLYAVDVEAAQIRHYSGHSDVLRGLPHDHVIAVSEDSKGRLWVGTDGGGLARYDHATDGFVVYQHDPDAKSTISNDEVRSIFEDRSGNIWIGTAGGGLNLLDGTNGTFRHFIHDPDNPNSLGEGQIPAIFEDHSGTLWVGTEHGLSEWRPGIQAFVSYESQSSDMTSLVHTVVNDIFQDRSGVLWVATNGGVSSWNYFSDTFTHYRAEQGFLESDVVTTIAEAANGVLWVGTYGGGLSRLDLAANNIRHYRHDANDPRSLSDDQVMVVHVDGAGIVWVGTRSGGLNRLQADGGFSTFRNDPDNPASISGDAISSLHTDADGGLWVGAFDNGLNYLAPDSQGEFQRYISDPNDKASLSSNRILVIHRDLAGQLWIGTEDGGVNLLHSDGETFSRYRTSGTQDINEEGLGTVWDIVETKDSTLWMSTLGDGLLSWQASERRQGQAKFDRYGKSEGLASSIYGAVVGGMGEIWASSSRGLYRIDPVSRDVRLFDRKNGLQGTEFNQAARLRSRSGRLLFGSNQGLLGFFPGEIARNSKPPQIRLTARSRKENFAKVSEGESGPHVQLDYLDPFISFDFVALDFVSPDKNRYRYRLVGFDSQWMEEDRFRRAVYTNLSAGEYRFEVQGTNNDGVWSEASASVAVTVTPPPWQQAWAYVLYALTVLCLAGWYFQRQRLEHRREAEQRAALEAQVTERTKELAERNEDLQAVNEKLAEASVTDSLTGLHNRRYVDQFIDSQTSLVQRRLMEGPNAGDDSDVDSSKLLFFMMIDLDGFKYVNDTYGHHAGDMVLVQVKDVLLGCCRQSDVVVRWGGDEFMIIGHASSFAGVKILAERIREALIERNYNVGRDNEHGKVSGSIGVAPYPFADDVLTNVSWEQVAAVADKGAYLAKNNGRNAWVSVRGLEDMLVEDFAMSTFDIARLMSEGKLELDSSVEATLNLDAGVTERYGAVGG